MDDVTEVVARAIYHNFFGGSRDAAKAALTALSEAGYVVVKREDDARRSAISRALNIDAPEDGVVESICELHGYGAVMDAAARLWALKDPMGAFYIGGCLGVRDLRAALKGGDNE